MEEDKYSELFKKFKVLEWVRVCMEVIKLYPIRTRVPEVQSCH
jgi:hypothetical protein